MSELDKNFYRPSQDQLEKIVPKIIDKEYLQDMNNMINSIPDEVKLVHDTTGFHVSVPSCWNNDFTDEDIKLNQIPISLTELQNKINQQSIEIDNLNKEISRLRNEMMNLIQAGK